MSNLKNEKDSDNIFKVSESGTIEDFQAISKGNKYMVNDIDINDENCIFHAVRGGNNKMVDHFLSLDCSNLNHLNTSGKNVLDIAEEMNNINMVRRFSKRLFPKDQRYCPRHSASYSYVYEIERTIFENRVDEIDPSIYGSDLFLLACKYNSSEIIIKCIENKHHLDYRDEHGSTPMSFLSFHENELKDDLLDSMFSFDSLLVKDKNKQLPQEYSNDINFILSVNSKIFHNDFKIFNHDDFTFPNKKESPKGAYGEAILVTHKVTGCEMVIKKSYECSDGLIEKSITNELSFLRKYKEVRNVVDIYGICIFDGTINLVLEKLDRTLYDYVIETIQSRGMDDDFDITSFSIDLMEKLLRISYNVNSTGVSHNDMKFHNIMFDQDDNIKLIDFGISCYHGLNPGLFRYHSMMTDFIKPKENGYKSLNSDVFSIGVLIFNILFSYCRFVSNYKTIGRFSIYHIKFNSDGENFFIYKGDDTSEINLFEDNDSSYFLILLKKMINEDPSKRPFARECLKDVLFTDVEQTERVLPKLVTRNPCVIIPYNSFGHELMYHDEIIKDISRVVINPYKIPPESKKKLIDVACKVNKTLVVENNKLMVCYNNRNLPSILKNNYFEYKTDVLFHVISSMKRLFHLGFIEEGEENLYAYILCLFAINYFCYVEINTKFVMEYTSNTEDEIQKAIHKIFSAGHLFCVDFVSVSSLVSSLFVKLQILSVEEEKMERVNKDIFKFINLFMIKNENVNMRLVDIVCSAFKKHDEYDIVNNKQACELYDMVINK